MRLTHLTIIATIIITVISIAILPHKTEAQKLNPVIVPMLVGKYPITIPANPNTNRIYIANADDNTASVIDGNTNKVITDIKVGHDPEAASANPNTNRIYIANADDNSISVIDGKTSSVVKTIPVGGDPEGVAVG
jgi:YVTN family beta-propeller protein